MPTPTDVPSPPSGVERLEEYFNESGEFVAPVDNNRVSSERLSWSYDRLVNSAGELERLGEAATEGETVRVARPVTPDRTTEWSKINVDNFIVSFESRWGENGEPIVKPADGADVGGIHIAESQSVRNVLIERLGFDGDEATMDDQVSDLDTVRCDDPASRGSRIRDLYARWTHPYHEHSTGGSGISLNAERVRPLGGFAPVLIVLPLH